MSWASWLSDGTDGDPTAMKRERAYRLHRRGGPVTVEWIKMEEIGGIVPACGGGRCRRGSPTTQREKKKKKKRRRQQQQKGVFAAEKGEVVIKLDPYS